LRENHCGTYKVHFLDHVLLMLGNKENEIHIPYLGAHVLPLAIGVQYDKQQQRAGGHRRSLGRAPRNDPGLWQKALLLRNRNRDHRRLHPRNSLPCAEKARARLSSRQSQSDAEG